LWALDILLIAQGDLTTLHTLSAFDPVSDTHFAKVLFSYRFTKSAVRIVGYIQVFVDKATK
jgi:hypothetical protein